jgi:heme exporter protein B
VWTGKFFFNLVLLLGLEVIIIPLFFILLNPRVSDWGGFLAILILGSIGLAGATTLIAAIIAQAKGKGALLAGLSYPILIPLLAAATSGTRHLFRGDGGAGQETQILAAYAVVVITAASLLFEFIWNE